MGATLLWSVCARRRTETARHWLKRPTSKQCTWHSSRSTVYEAPIVCFFFVHSVIHLLLYARMIQRCSSEFRFVQSPPPTSPNATSVRLFCLVRVVFFFLFFFFVFMKDFRLCKSNSAGNSTICSLFTQNTPVPKNNRGPADSLTSCFHLHKVVSGPETLLIPEMNPKN